jgi:hypothetical protein
MAPSSRGLAGVRAPAGQSPDSRVGAPHGNDESVVGSNLLGRLHWGFGIGCDGLAMNMKGYMDDVRID